MAACCRNEASSVDFRGYASRPSATGCTQDRHCCDRNNRPVDGVALIILPGPAFIVIPIGLAILATEFIWARRVVKRGRIFVKRAGRAVKSKVAT